MNWPSREVSLFGIPTYAASGSFESAHTHLRAIWDQQRVNGPRGLAIPEASLDEDEFSHESLARELRLMKHWFDPVASGKRVRDIISAAPIETHRIDAPAAATTVRLGADRVLLNLEGRAALWVLERNRPLWESTDPFADSFLPAEDCFFAVASVEIIYRDWTQQKIQSVSDLMLSETSTLRPTAAGLLLFLLLNRHTSKERALPLPTNAALSATISDAIAGPVLAFAQGISGSTKSSDRGVDLYRGWALGEIQRRLGGDLRKEDGRIWIDGESLEQAIGRLADAVSARTNAQTISDALALALSAYEQSRSRLASIGIAYERPGATADLFSRISSAQALAQARAEGTS